MKKSLLIILLVVFVDQAIKLWIKTTMTLGQEFPVIGNWFLIHFTENEGMAFGMKFGGDFGKLILSIFRMAAIVGIAFYLVHAIRRNASSILIVSLSLIMAGAIGNVIDSAFYGMIFSASKYHETAVLFPQGGGYSNFLHGKVVDMLYFPLFTGNYPEWLPFFGGKEFIFFRPVFNIADSAITSGVFILILFQKTVFKKR